MRTNRIATMLSRPLRRLGLHGLRDDSRRRQLGQVLPIFAIMSIVLLGGAALLTDVAWWWTNELRMKSAADAAALAGAVYLPSDQSRAFTAALDEAQKNGYVDVSRGGTAKVTPRRDLPDNPRKLIVDISGQVQTNFARVFCWNSTLCLQKVDIGVTGAAEFVLPVPMGSPENYYGVFGITRNLTSTASAPAPDIRGWSCGSGDTWNTGSGCVGPVPTVSQGGGWSPSAGTMGDALRTENNRYATVTVDGTSAHQWSRFGIQSGAPPANGAQMNMPNPAAGQRLDIVGLQVRLTDAFITASCSSARIQVELSWGGGAANTWTAPVDVPSAAGSLGTNTGSGDYTIGNSGDMLTWQPPNPQPNHLWTRDDFLDGNFRIRLTATEGCGTPASRTFNVDMVDMRVTWMFDDNTTVDVETPVPDQLLHGPGRPCDTLKADCFEADGVNLNPRGFWATLNSQGAENVDGDAHQTGYDTRTGTPSKGCADPTLPAGYACIDGANYYNYAIELPPGATSGAVYIYDPQHCGVATGSGTGDRWFSGGAGVGTFYEVYDTGTNNRYDPGPGGDTRVAYSDGRFRNLDATDSTMGGGTGGADCRYRSDTQYGDGRDYHNRWYLLYSGMTGGANGHVYVVHTTSTDPSNTTTPAPQLGTDAENSFAIFVSASTPSGGSPKVYGLGAMQAFTPLTAGGPVQNPCPGAPTEECSEFYLAQIEAAHAGKTIEIQLWDPGDTNPLTANLQSLIPTPSGWTPTTFTYTAAQGTTNSNRASCNSLTSPSGGTNIVQTNVGNTNGTFNGCWLTLRAQIPSTYVADQEGWWRIRYRMRNSGGGADTSNDVTTWKVNIIGNPVHLVMP